MGRRRRLGSQGWLARRIENRGSFAGAKNGRGRFEVKVNWVHLKNRRLVEAGRYDCKIGAVVSKKLGVLLAVALDEFS
jgi:hypothetical protein